MQTTPKRLTNLFLAFISALVLLISVLALSGQISAPVHAQSTKNQPRSEATHAVQDLANTPALTITAPTANTVLTTSLPPTYLIQIEYDCGTTCTGSAILDVVSVTVNGGMTYHQASLNGMSGRYVYTWDLPSEDYVEHVIIARAINLGGVTGASTPVTVIVDRVAPTTTAQAPAIQQGLTPIPVSWEATDTHSGVASVRLYYQYAPIDTALLTDTVWQNSGLAAQSGLSGIFSFTPTAVGTYTFATQASDHVGNQELLPTVPDTWTRVQPAPQRVFLPLVLRNFPPIPSGQITIKDGAIYVYAPQVTLALNATIQGDTVTEMRLRNESAEWGDWQAFTETINWSLTSGTNGLKTVYVQFKGALGGVSGSVYDAIYLSRNGSFETGALQPEWQGTSSPLPWSIVQSVSERPSGSTPPADGQYAVLLGNPDYSCNLVPQGHAAIASTFQIPVGATKLVFHYIIWSQDLSTRSTYDRFEVYINGKLKLADGNLTRPDTGCSKWRRIPGPDNPRNGQTTGWATGEIDVSNYAGSTVTVSFQNWNRFDSWYNTYTYVDAVRIEGDW